MQIMSSWAEQHQTSQKFWLQPPASHLIIHSAVHYCWWEQKEVPFAPSEIRTHDHQMPAKNPKRYVITATFLYYKHQIFAILWVTKMLIEAKE